MITGTDFYIWSPNFFQYRDPETGKFFGNVIGNFSLEDQLAIVDDEGTRQKNDIQVLGNEQTLAVKLLSGKFTHLWTIIDDVEKAMTGEDPVQREDGSDFIEAFLASYVPPVPEDDTNTEPSSEQAEPVSSGAEYYIWTPNYFKAKDPESGNYFGTVIGNVPAQEQIWMVTEEGSRQKEAIRELGTLETEGMFIRSEKYRHVTGINKNVMKEIIAFFGGVFILDSSALDSAPLG